MKKGKLLQSIFFAAVLLLPAAELSAQNKAEMVVIPNASIKTANGYLYIYNTPIRSIMIELKGEEVTPAKNTNVPMFFVDGKLVQIVTVDIQSFTGDKLVAGVDETLETHKIWESDSLGTQYGQKLKVESEKVAIGDVKALFWGFKRPSSNESFDRDYYLSTLFGSNLLMLCSPVKPSESVADYKNLLTGIMSTIKISSQPFDILKISEGLRGPAKTGTKPRR